DVALLPAPIGRPQTRELGAHVVRQGAGLAASLTVHPGFDAAPSPIAAVRMNRDEGARLGRARHVRALAQRDVDVSGAGQAQIAAEPLGDLPRELQGDVLFEHAVRSAYTERCRTSRRRRATMPRIQNRPYSHWSLFPC